MNETKRQLDQYIGDTTENTKRVMAMVEQNKQKRSTTKRKTLVPIFSTIATVAALLALFFIVNPFNKESAEPTEEKPLVTDEQYADTYRTLFKMNGDVAYFTGEGNEYATFTETTHWLNENFDYVSVTVDNGGSIIQSIYRITDKKLALVLMEEVSEPKLDYTLEQLKDLEEIDVIFEGPIEDGERPDGSVITTNITFKTPYKLFKEAISVKQFTDGTTTEIVYAKGLGVIGKTFTAADGNQAISLLETIDEAFLIIPPEPASTLEAYRSLFKQDGTIAHFKGDGIEYSTFDEKTIWVGDYVIVRVDNGGSIFDRIYHISAERLALVGQNVVDRMDDTYSLQELEAMDVIEVLFEGPIEAGTAPNGDEIVMDLIIETPYKTFVVITTQRTETDGSINETYYAPGYGIVGTRFISPDGYQVQSLLHSIDENGNK